MAKIKLYTSKHVKKHRENIVKKKQRLAKEAALQDYVAVQEVGQYTSQAGFATPSEWLEAGCPEDVKLIFR